MSTPTFHPDPHAALVKWAEELLRYGPELGHHCSYEGSDILSQIRKINATQTAPANAGGVLREVLEIIPPDHKLYPKVQALIGKLRVCTARVMADHLMLEHSEPDFRAHVVEQAKVAVGVGAATEHATIAEEMKRQDNYDHKLFTATLVVLIP